MRDFIDLPDDHDTLLHLYVFNIIYRSALHRAYYTEPDIYIKLYNYIKIFVEFYIANTIIAKVYITRVEPQAAKNKTPPPAAATHTRVAAARRQ